MKKKTYTLYYIVCNILNSRPIIRKCNYETASGRDRELAKSKPEIDSGHFEQMMAVKTKEEAKKLLLKFLRKQRAVLVSQLRTIQQHREILSKLK